MTAECEIHEEFANREAVEAWIEACSAKGMSGMVDVKRVDMGGYEAVMHLVLDGQTPTFDPKVEGSVEATLDWLINQVRELTAWRAATDAVRLAADEAAKARTAHPDYEPFMIPARKAEEDARTAELMAEGMAMAGGPEGLAAIKRDVQGNTTLDGVPIVQEA